MSDRSIAASATGSPQFVAAVVVRDAAAELPDLLASFECQGVDWDALSVFVVDAGSHDVSGEVLERWARRFPGKVQMLGPRADILAARNAVLDAVDSAFSPDVPVWVTFPDPRDTWEPGYLAALREAAQRGRSVLIASRPLVWTPEEGVVEPPKNGDEHFQGRASLVDLQAWPDPVTTSVRSVCVELAALREHGLRFDRELAAGFADQHFLARALLTQEEARLALAPGARYRFRKRLEAATGAREPFRDPAKFTTVLRAGHLDLLRLARRPDGAIPAWVQKLVLDDLGSYFRADETLSGQMNAEMHHVADEFHSLVERIVAEVDLDVLDSLDSAVFPLDRRISLRRGYRGETWHEEPVVLEQSDPRRHLVRLSYRFTGPAPREEIVVDGAVVQPHHAKTRQQVYAGRVLVRERILWVSSDASVAVRLDGSVVRLSRAHDPYSRAAWQPSALRAAFSKRRGPASDLTVGGLLGRVLSPAWWANRLVRTLARIGPVRRRYGGSWVLIDRVDSAHDNAEHLFKYLSTERTETQAWFALERGTHDWKRLQAEGNRRLLAYGSLRWKLVCLNASHVISSQAGPYVYKPAALEPVGRPSWRFVFLQHGVIATDLSRWLNRRDFDLFVTTTNEEFAAIAGAESLYRFTTREVALTGLPRHDRLFRLNEHAVPSDRRRILVLPSWREYLLGKIGPKGDRGLIDDFESTRYAQAWAGLLRSPRLAELARQHDAAIAFMPHPNIQPYLDRLDLPAHVEVLTYGGNDIQEVLVSAKVVVTDFSSVVFDAAYIGHPIVYYQFDQDEAFGGTHTVRQGYFSYEEDGFGPVVYTENEALSAIEGIARAGFVPSDEHAERMERAFPARDAASCRRVIDAIRAVDRPEMVSESVRAPIAPKNRRTPTKPVTHQEV